MFDLTQGPLLRSTLLRLGSQDHILLLTMHHIVSDGQSMEVLFRELSALYQAFSAGKPSPLHELPIQYADFACWQRQWLQGEVLEKQLSYWRQQLKGAPPVLELPTDHPRPPVQTYRGARQSLALSKTLSQALKALSRQEGVTLFMTLLAAFQTLLQRYTGQDDIVVGTPTAGRTRSEIEELIGFFLNTVVLRTDLSGNPSFRDLLVRVRQVALGAYTHQDLPFEKLLEELQPERDLSRTPLFQVFFNMDSFGDRLELPGLTAKPPSFLEPGSKFDLTLYFGDQNEEIQFLLVYNADIFEQDRMVEMLGQLEHLLCQIVENPDESIERFSLVTPNAQRYLPNPAQLLDSDWKGAVQTHFSLLAQRFPQHIAVVDKWEAWTYKDLDSRSNQLANYLLGSGIECQDIVAIYGHRSAPLVLAVLGVLKAGAAFLILDPAYPADRLIHCLQAAKPRGWLQLEAAGPVPAALEEFIATSSLRCRFQLRQNSTGVSRDPLKGYSDDDPGVAVGPDDLAYVAFTSGSTGCPKGILGRHGPLSHFLPWQEETFNLGTSDRFSILSGLSHDPLQRDIFTPLWLGATICIPDPKIIGTSKLAHWMAKEQVTFAHLTPAMAELLTETSAPDCRIPSLRYAFFIGDKLTRWDVVRLRRLAPGVTCINSYGATETQRAVGHYVVPQEPEIQESRDRAVYPVGRGMKDVQLLVLNAEQRLAGVGEPGEIYVRSPHLALGYVGDEELTQARFLTNPFTGAAGDQLYKTGDLGRYLPDGNVEFFGRTDRQVKIRGFRIELGEIEAILRKHRAVRETVVVAREDTVGNQLLIAYVVPSPEHASHIRPLAVDGDPLLSLGELKGFLSQKLPAYMVPSAFVMLDALPLTPNGKVGYRALPAPDGGRLGVEETFVAPRTPVENVLVRIWREVLGIDQLGIYDNFFDLGGHSLLATQVISRVRATLQVDLPLRTLFEAPTVAGLAMRITQSQTDKAEPEDIASLLAELERTSDEEAEEVLSEETLRSSEGNGHE
ncbi:MAG: amino acid adenylation domain-containing protein [Deltaproteobacteria bacterium]|nr:amino acid adenylation domain-containing protein [Deltaproteobacteria bacterium]